MYKKNARSAQKRMALAAAGILTSIGFVLMPGAVQAADLNLDTQQKADNISAEWNPETDNTTGMTYVYHNSSVDGNTITIGNVKLSNHNIYGAVAGSRTNADVKSDVVNNTVIVSNAEIAGSLRGALVYKGYNAINNKVIFNDSTLSKINNQYGEIYGAAVYDTGYAKNNQVAINSDLDSAAIYGATVANGNAEGNIVTINEGEVKGRIYGATSSGTGNLINNTVEINGGTIEGNVYGAYGGNVEVKGNTIVIRDKANVEKANLYGGRGTGTSTDNKLVIDHWNGKVNNIDKVDSITFQNIILGNGSPILSKSSEGKLVLNNSEYNLKSIGAYDQDGNAIDLKKNDTNYKIKFFGDNIKFDENKFSSDSLDNLKKDVIAETDTGVRVHGFNVEKDKTSGKDTMNELVATVNKSILTGVYTNDDGTYGESNNKTLTIDKGFTTNADVISASYGAGDNDAAGGTILIASDADSAINYNLLGGKSDNGKVSDNTLSIDGWRGTVNSISAFDNYKFENVALNQKDAVLNFVDTNNTEIKADSNFEVISLAQGQTINKGDSTKLIAGKDLSGVDKSQQIAYGTALDITSQIKGRQDGIDLKINDVKASAQTKSVNEGRVSALGFLNQGSDLVSKGIASLNERGKYGVETFAAMQGDDISFDEVVDISGWHGIVGVGNNVKSGAGDFAWGVFAEKGDGSFDTQSTVNGNFVSGDGSVDYNGGGIAARLTKDSGMYTEAFFRAGKIKHEVDHGLQDELGNIFDYRTDSSYYGFGLSAGKIFRFDNGNTMDAYLKYFHSNIGSDSFTLSNGEVYDMDDINSDRIRLGARYNQSFGKNSLYYGAAWEYEFSGDSDGTAQGYAIDTASLEGSTFIGELGFNFAPTEDSPWDFDLSVKGFAGEREGFIGNMQAMYHF